MNDYLREFPHVLDEDKTTAPLGELTAERLEILLGDVEKALIMCAIQTLPEEVCDILARDFKVEWYDYGATVETKRDQIAMCIYIHRHKGTLGAVRDAISALHPQSEIVEWFDDDTMREGFFRVVITDAERYRLDRLLSVVGYAKKLSALIDGVELHDSGDTRVGVSFASSDVLKERGEIVLEYYPMDDFGTVVLDDFGKMIVPDIY